MGGWTATNRRQLVSMPLLVSDGVSTLAEVAAGNFDSYYNQWGNAFIRNGATNAIIRIGWEFNGGWFPWHAFPNTSDWIAAYQHVVNLFRGFSTDFQFDWCSNFTIEQGNPETCYPGDSYVDFIGMDTYDYWYPAQSSAATRWNLILTQPYCLEWHAAFATTHSKPMSYPEWGCTTRTDGSGGGDDPLFINNMSAWFTSNNVAYQAYFDQPGTMGDLYGLQNFPNAQAAYLADFGG